MRDARKHARTTIGWAAVGLICACGLAATAPAAVEIRTDDVARFFALYERSDGTPSAAQVQAEYLNRGTAGLREFVEARIDSAEKLAHKISEKPQLYAHARTCAEALPDIRERLDDAFVRLAEIYPRSWAVAHQSMSRLLFVETAKPLQRDFLNETHSQQLTRQESCRPQIDPCIGECPAVTFTAFR